MTRALSLLGLLGFAYVLLLVPSPAPGGAYAAMLLGFVLLASYLAGFVAAQAGLPRLSGYVVLGIVVGPSVLGIVTPGALVALRTVDELALALIALTAGGELRIDSLRGTMGTIGALSLAVMGMTIAGIMALVLVARPLVPMLATEPLSLTLAVALLLGVWCANSSPDVTVAVINETGARGRLTDTILGVTIFKDVLVIISFAVALAVAGTLVDPAASFDGALVAGIAWEVGGAFLLGGAAGWLFGFYLRQVGQRTVVATLIFTFLLILLAHELHVELLLTAVAAGFVIENFSAVGDDLIRAIEANSLAVYAVFFAIAGASLDLGALIAYWPLALAVVLVRAGLTWAGVRVGSRLSGADAALQPAWMGLISQAGVTLGLSLLVAREFPGWGAQFVSVTAAIIIVHLLLGPILLKLALSRAGEIDGGVPEPVSRPTPPPAPVPAPAG